MVKRTFDFLAAATLLVLLSPAIAAIAAVVRWRLGSPVLFRQRRVGLGGRPFDILKFRTMRDASGTDGQPLPDEERLTPFGRLLRSTSLDELPGLVNVLRGEMSLVGPRPLLPPYLRWYTPEQNRRHDVRPGITGWAQVNGRNAIGWTEKFALDVWYVDHQSLGLDLRILLRTVAKVVRRSDISAAGEATMAAFGPETSQRVVVFGLTERTGPVIASLRRDGWFVEAVYDDTAAIGQTIDGVSVAGTLIDYANGPTMRAAIALSDPTAQERIRRWLDWIAVDGTAVPISGQAA